MAGRVSNIEEFIAYWGNTSEGNSRKERSNLQLLINDLCFVLELPPPEKALPNNDLNSYTYEHSVKITEASGRTTTKPVDLYKKGCFVLEGKDTGKSYDSDSWNKDIQKALGQAESYARNVPLEDGRPPFIIIVDVGVSFVLYSEFSRSGSNYIPFPDARSHKITLDQLRDPDIQELLRTIWLEPLKLDPVRNAGKVTRIVSDQLAQLAKSLEAAGHKPERVASFLMRSLFTMFAEDVGLLPERTFTELLERYKASPNTFHLHLESLWKTMNSGGFSEGLNSKIMRFNGGLFAEATAIELDSSQIDLLIGAARCDWKKVEPSIFGTLLERALNPKERHKLGAHYTPRAYVERLVFPTIIEPLRSEWADVQATVEAYRKQRKTKDAIAELQGFLAKLCNIRVLDPACGSGNFLYVTMEHMKRLEGEVLELLGSIKKTGSFDMEGLTVDPHQFLGIEINPRAAKVAEMVLWIGYLQWHFRTHGQVNPPEPVLRDFHNIENRDALLKYDAVEVLIDENGKPLTRWDGVTYKASPITGEQIPDESAQVEQYKYINPRKAEWPEADYIVGNPPFIGNKRMRLALGDGYVDCVKSTWSEVSESSDFVMYWWHIAADSVRTNRAKQFGFITTNSIKQTFNRRIIETHLKENPPISIVYAIPDHPWVDSADGAAVRIAMTVASKLDNVGRLVTVFKEESVRQDEIEVKLKETKGSIFADLKVGIDVVSAKKLFSNSLLSNRGMIPNGSGFLVDKETCNNLDKGALLKPYRNNKDLTDRPRGMMVIDTFGLSENVLKENYPQTWQWLYDRVKPERDQNKRKSVKENWWLFGEQRKLLRKAHEKLNRYIVTGQTSKHRFFQFLTVDIIPDDKLIAIASERSDLLGVLSSRVHVIWSLSSGSNLGVGNDAVYNKSFCFDAFPFPELTENTRKKIDDIAEKIDFHRKNQQTKHADLTLTGMYNVLEKLRTGEALNVKEKVIHEQGLVSILKEIHDELDRAVFEAYGWSDLADKLVGKPGATTPYLNKPEEQIEAEEELLRRLVALNIERSAEEAQGHIRWLRPEYQNPHNQQAATQAEVDLSSDEQEIITPIKAAAKLNWPKTMREQIALTRQLVSNKRITAQALADQFKGGKKTLEAVQDALDALEEMGMINKKDDSYYSN